ncbi:MAG TPA: M56 family metallopeptidase [Sphingomicrobium sp.]|nr:M56 family metallopeptidase [Sphingomicrobium sp.]
MIQVLIAIAVKSLLVAGATLGILMLMKKRSAAERSWVAHIGLLALVVMAFAPMVLPTWNVEAPALFGRAPTTEISVAPVQGQTTIAPAAVLPTTAAPAPARPLITASAAASAIYALPAAILLLITALALARLIALRARADVLVDGHWLSALARAQRRMGFKHGTALLTSNELASPISWGLMRPVILLNSRAVEAAGEAEAIIAHELAHVARMDWVKLLLARLATALFWFNPLVWILAREAHQLREEAADDAVLGADIADTDYAQLLVGVARHECPGLLLGAHGVAPSKSSLARRVARVLDGTSVRGPGARSFAIGVFVGAVVVAAPLAALTFSPAGSKSQAPLVASTSLPGTADHPVAQAVPADLPHIIASGVSTSVATAAQAIAPVTGKPDFEAVGPNGAKVVATKGAMVATGPDGSKVTVYPPDALGRSRVVAVAANGATAVSYADAGAYAAARGQHESDDDSVDTAIKLKVLGIDAGYLAAMRAAAPSLRDADVDEIISLKQVGASPQYVRDLANSGLRNLTSDDFAQARVVGITGDYARAILATGVRADLDQLIELRTMGITPGDLARAHASGKLSGDELHRLAVRGPPQPPQPPPPPGDSNDD